MELISTQIKTTGFIYLGEQNKYSGYHQPARNVDTYVQYPISLNINNGMLGYNPLIPLPVPLIIGYNPLTISEVPTEETFVGIYVCFDAYDYGNSFIPFDKYTGGVEFIKQAYGGSNPFTTSKPTLRINGANGNYALYRFELAARYISKNKYYRYVENTASAPVPEKPNYLCFANGYYLDNRTIPSNPKIIPTISGTQTIGYYQKNPMEGIPDLTTIEWREYQIECQENQPIYLPIYNLVLGTLYCSSDMKTFISASVTQVSEYSWVSAFPDGITPVFADWMSLYNPLASAQNSIVPNTTDFSSILSTKTIQTFELDRVIRRISANNNCWGTTPITELDNDLNSLSNHPMFLVNPTRTYDYHFSPQKEGIGSLKMDSPRLIEISKALNAPKYSRNELAPNTDRVTNLGFLVDRIAELLGISLDANGDFEVDTQKAEYETKCADIRQPLDTSKYSAYGFGKEGMAIANLPNNYNGSNPVNGGGSIVKTLPGLMLDLHAQLNKSVGIQDGSNIVFSVGDKKVHYPNQVALLIDLSRTVAIMSQLLSTVYTNSLQTESEVREIIGALGLGTVDDSVGLNINGQSVNVPYKGVDRRESLVNELADIKLTLAVIMGKLI